jgi:H+-transporting ATPase
METSSLDHVSDAEGINSAEAESRRAKYGLNELHEEQPHPALKLLKKFWGPIPWLLEVAMVLQIGLRAYSQPKVQNTIS